MSVRGRKRDKDQQEPPVDEGMMMDRGQLKPYKICVQCKRPMVQRAKWKDPQTWKEVKYCSDSCRKAGKSGGAAGTSQEQPQQQT